MRVRIGLKLILPSFYSRSENTLFYVFGYPFLTKYQFWFSISIIILGLPIITLVIMMLCSPWGGSRKTASKVFESQCELLFPLVVLIWVNSRTALERFGCTRISCMKADGWWRHFFGTSTAFLRDFSIVRPKEWQNMTEDILINTPWWVGWHSVFGRNYRKTIKIFGGFNSFL